MGKIVNNPSFSTEEDVVVPVTPAPVVEEPEIEEIEVQVTEPEAPTPEPPVESPSSVKIGDREYTEAELQAIVEKGSKVQEWETKMPGFNLDTLMPDYTQKSQRLAAFEKPRVPKSKAMPREELEKLGVDDGQIKAFEAVASHLGYVRQTDLTQDSVEAQKDAFIAAHPEYSPGDPINDARWGKLMERFSLYNWQSNPNMVSELLEEAHTKISAGQVEQKRGGQARATITTTQAKAALAALGGGSGGSAAPVAPVKVEKSVADKYRNMGWTEEQISDTFN